VSLFHNDFLSFGDAAHLRALVSDRFMIEQDDPAAAVAETIDGSESAQ
jgi:hypothetical protein